MSTVVDYYHSLNSPWSYLGHERLMTIAARHNATVRVHPVDFLGTIFPATGGVPVPKRPPARQAFRLQELERWRAHLGVPLNLHPAHWPADERFAAAIEIAIREDGGDACAFAGAVMRAVWADERDMADEDTVIDIARSVGVDANALRSRVDECLAIRERESQQAIERNVFGAPTYIVGEQLLWGQDRLDFVERALAAAGGYAGG